MSQHHVNPDLIHRTAWGNPLWNALHNLNITGLCLAGSIITALIWPLALPVCLLFTLVTSVIFMLQRWRCPLRMPMTLSLDDPSQDRKVRRSLFSFWPTLFQYEADETFPARGIFYVGYRRINDIGRELWLSMDDLTRHVMFFATTGGGKTETTFAWLLNPLCWGRGFTFVDGKAQNDTTRTIWYLSRRFGREDDIEVINFMNGGKSRSEIIQSGEKSRPQSNTWNPFAFSTEAFTAETMQSMLPQNVQGGEWQSRAIAMNKALVFGTKFWCVREGKTMSLQMLREHMTLEGMAKLYCRGLDDQWPEDKKITAAKLCAGILLALGIVLIQFLIVYIMSCMFLPLRGLNLTYYTQSQASLNITAYVFTYRTLIVNAMLLISIASMATAFITMLFSYIIKNRFATVIPLLLVTLISGFTGFFNQLLPGMVIDQFFPSQMVHFTQFFKVALNPHLGEMLPYFSIRGYSLAWKNVIMLFWIVSIVIISLCMLQHSRRHVKNCS